MAQESQSRDLDKVIVRMPDGMRERIKDAAALNGRSMNSEIVALLSASSSSLRDTFAGLAMAAIISKIEVIHDNETRLKALKSIAAGAYAYADAMIAAREGK